MDGGTPPLHRRSSDHEFRDVLGKGLSNARRNLVTVGLFSVAVNLLVLAIPIYLFNMSDRVLTSRSTDTLVMLTMIVVIAIVAHVVMDMMRRIILMRVAVETESRLGGPVLSAAAKAAQGGSSREFQTLADLQHLRSFITGPVSADDVRCAGVADLFRRGVSDSSASRLHRAAHRASRWSWSR